MKTINWLHMSDIHYNFDNYNTIRMRDKTINYIESLNIKFDFIVITGDIKYKNSSYTDDTIKFLDNLCQKIGIEKKNLFLVPGNHDIKRSNHRERLIKGTLNNSNPSSEINELDLETFEDLISAQDEFFCFYNKLLGRDYNKDTLHFVENRNEYNIIHINTCLVSGIDNEDTESKLIIGQKKLNVVLKNIDKNVINFAIGHHNIECLNPIEQEHFMNNLADYYVDFYLSGHVHKPKAIFETNNIHEILLLGCGSGMSDNYSTVGIISGNINLSSKEGSISFHEWNPIHEQWQFANNIGRNAPNGKMSFTIKKSFSILNKHDSPLKSNIQIDNNDLIAQIEFSPPQCNNQIDRIDLNAQIEDKLLNFPIVIIEGLSGCGKTYLVSNYCNYRNKQYKEIIWYDAQKKECLDDFFARLSIKISFLNISNYSRCKQLMQHLKTKEILLVIDNYEKVDQNSFSELISFSTRFSRQANIIIISNKYVEYLDDITSIGTIELNGFNYTQVEKFIKLQSLKIEKDTINDLVKKTEGLPLAIEVFTILIKKYNYAPEDLLRDSITVYTRLEDWFTKILKEFNDKTNVLISMLSICEEPFNYNVVKKFCKSINISNIEITFESLQKGYLIQKYSNYRWQVHSLIANYCITKLDDIKKRAANLLMANYCNNVFKFLKNEKKDEEALFWRIKSCKYFQFANIHTKSQSIVVSISKDVKRIGYYELYSNICKNEIQNNPNRNQWIDYNYLHCCVILGRYTIALSYIEQLLKNHLQSIDLLLSLKRLYAEILSSLNQNDKALKVLDNALETTNIENVHQTIINQLKTTKIWVLISSGQFDIAKELCEKMLNNVAEKSFIHKAILLTRLGIIYETQQDSITAIKNLYQAVELFDICKDKRGYSWAISHLGFNQIKIGQYNEGITNIKKALRQKNEIGECSLDYFIFLQKLKADTSLKKIKRAVNAEEKRVAKQCNNIYIYSG